MSNTRAVKTAQSKELILKTIITYIDEHKYPPTIREICDITGFRSTSSVYNYLLKLKEDGDIETDHSVGTPRAIRISEKAISRFHDDAITSV